MKPIPEDLNKAFESKVRLGIMSVLMANESVDFVTLKSLLELTDGNLASHTRSLEVLGYLQSPMPSSLAQAATSRRAGPSTSSRIWEPITPSHSRKRS